MNNARRKEIMAIVDKVAQLDNLLNEIREETERLRDDEQDYVDCMPDNFREGERGQHSEEVISNFEEVLSALDDLDAETMRGYLETAAE